MEKKGFNGLEYEPDKKPNMGGNQNPMVFQPDGRGHSSKSINSDEQFRGEIEEEKKFQKGGKQMSFAKGGKGDYSNHQEPIVIGDENHQRNLIQEQTNNELLENEDLIANEEEIRDYKQLLNCSICQEITFLSKEPRYCTSCQSAVFCKKCINDWLKLHNTCPFCRKEKPDMKSIADNKNLLGLIKTVKLYCKYKNRGCQDILAFDQYEKHEKECGNCQMCKGEVLKKDMFTHFSESCNKYVLKCHYCSEERSREDMFNHRCYQMFCRPKKGGPDYYLTKNRITNIGDMKNIFEQLKCSICQNLMRQPKQCSNQKCESNVCQKCISESRKVHNECPMCREQNPIFIEINRVLKNLLIKAQIKCYNCRQDVSYEQLDEHELQCGKCDICSTKLSEYVKIPEHHINSCPKLKLMCVFCGQTIKRSEFKSHKCEVISQEELDKKKQEKMKNRAMKESHLLLQGASPEDAPKDKTDYQLHWTKKRKGCYMLGLGRWCKVCRQNTKQDLENQTKCFQIIFMMMLAILEWGLAIYAWNEVFMYRRSSADYSGMFIAGMTVELCWHLFVACIMYGVLAGQWEGYYDHRFLQVLHCITMILFSLIPHADLLLHMGYRQKGYRVKGKAEPFPDGFKIPKTFENYQGYLSNSFKGGFYTFFVLGYQRFALQLFRIAVWLAGLMVDGAIYNAVKCSHLILIVMIGNGFLSLLMLLKGIIENTNIKCCQGKNSKDRYNSLLTNEEII